MLINSPQNPTGGVMNENDLRILLQLSEKYGFYIVSDEAYEDIIYDEKHILIVALEGPQDAIKQMYGIYCRRLWVNCPGYPISRRTI